MIEQIVNTLYGKAIAVYSDSKHTHTFILGTLHAVDENFICIHSINRHGSYDGWACISLKLIFRIETNTQYTSRIYNRPSMKDSIYCESWNDIVLMLLMKNIMVDILLKNRKKIKGYIKKSQGNMIEISAVNARKGNAYILVDDIWTLSYEVIE